MAEKRRLKKHQGYGSADLVIAVIDSGEPLKDRDIEGAQQETKAKTR